MQCILPQNQTTPEKTLSNPWFGKGFCEPHQYKSAINRCENGYSSCELGIDIYENLVKILDNCSSAIRQWSTSSQKQIAQSRECGTTRKVWMESIRAIEKLAERNDDITKGIQKNVIDEMNHYKTQNYGKSFLHVKKIKEFDKEFKKVQKSWLELLEKINDAKQVYHEAKLKLQNAERAQNMIESDVGSCEEQIKKGKTSVETRKKKTETYKNEYQRLISEMNKAQPTYEQEMLKILARTDDFERDRLKHFNLILNGLKQATSIETDTRHKDMSAAFETAIKGHDIEADIKFFNKNYGSETVTKWPAFEDLQD